MRTFGGGRDSADARQPLLVTHNGNRLAFLGYNQFGPEYAWATTDKPGRPAFRWRPSSRSGADFVTSGFGVCEHPAHGNLQSGSTPCPGVGLSGGDAGRRGCGHGQPGPQPQAIEFYDGKPIFYGLGNLFFDQTWSEATCQSLIIRHFIYDGRLIASEVIPTVMDKHLQPRVADAEERESILQPIFQASGW